MSRGVNLTVRQFERNEVFLPAEFCVDPSQDDQIAFIAANNDARDRQTISVTVSDIGIGGIGFQSRALLPRMALGKLRIFDPAAQETDGDGQTVNRVLFEHAVRVRRTEMMSRLPTYFIGVSFEDPSAELHTEFTGFLEAVSAAMRETAARRLREAEGGGHARDH